MEQNPVVDVQSIITEEDLTGKPDTPTDTPAESQTRKNLRKFAKGTIAALLAGGAAASVITALNIATSGVASLVITGITTVAELVKNALDIKAVLNEPSPTI